MESVEGGPPVVGELVSTNVSPRWIYHSIASIDGLADLRAAFARKMGDEFVAGAWEPYAKSEKFAELTSALHASLEVGGRAASAA
jgi:hypothetical protein